MTLGAEGEGMVAGDLVNTASRDAVGRRARARCSSARRRGARPSRRSSTRSAGEHELKGKAEPVPLWRALRVVSGRGGALKSAGWRRRSSAATASCG